MLGKTCCLEMDEDREGEGEGEVCEDDGGWRGSSYLWRWLV
jgi:hypothetical protein